MMRRWALRTWASAATIAVFFGTAGLRADDESPDSGKGSASVSIELKDGKLTVTDSKGKKHEIEIGELGVGAGAVELLGKALVFTEEDGQPRGIKLTGKGKAFEGEVDADIMIVGPDGKPQKLKLLGNGESAITLPGGVQASGKVVIVGPDGEKQEFDWKDAKGAIRGLTLKAGAGGGKFMLGLECEPVSEALREQLKLEQGLIVVSVFDETPAAKAGIKKHDIILKAGEGTPASIEDLTKAVQKAGEDGQPLQLTVLRRGAEQAFAVQPIERKGVVMKLDEMGIHDAQIREKIEQALQGSGIDRLMIEKIEPGVIGEGARQFILKKHKDTAAKKQEDSEIADLQKKVEELSRQLDELKQAIAAESASDKDK